MVQCKKGQTVSWQFIQGLRGAFQTLDAKGVSLRGLTLHDITWQIICVKAVESKVDCVPHSVKTVSMCKVQFAYLIIILLCGLMQYITTSKYTSYLKFLNKHQGHVAVVLLTKKYCKPFIFPLDYNQMCSTVLKSLERLRCHTKPARFGR